MLLNLFRGSRSAGSAVCASDKSTSADNGVVVDGGHTVFEGHAMEFSAIIKFIPQ